MNAKFLQIPVNTLTTLTFGHSGQPGQGFLSLLVAGAQEMVTIGNTLDRPDHRDRDTLEIHSSQLVFWAP